MADNFVGITDTGQVRTNNEDAFIAQKLGGYIAACVIDGVGGYEGGEVAAATARQAIVDYLSVPSGDITTMMREAFIVANEKITAEKKQNPRYENMACVATLAMVDVATKTFYYAHIGDTRLYLFRDHSLIKVTKDQSFVGYLEDNGRITEEEAMLHPKRNEINAALGFDAQLNPADIETGSSPFLPGDLLLLCSDGLSDLLKSSDMAAILEQEATLQTKGKILVQEANARGGKDNITVVLVRNHRKPVMQKATRPVATTEVKKSELPEAIPVEHEKTTEPKKRKRNVLTGVLATLCLVLAAVVVLLLLQKAPVLQGKKQDFITQAETANASFQQLLDTLKTKTFSIPDSMAALPVVLSDTVWIRKDSFHLQGNGMRFLKSADFNGPAIALGDSCKHVLLENVLFENFDVAVLVQNKALQLKNVRFINCWVPVQIALHFSESLPVSGAVTTIFATDSLHQ